jgi:hypothetical protein
MTEEIIIAGFGGQGVLSMGKNPGVLRIGARKRSELDTVLRSGTKRRNSQCNRDIEAMRESVHRY